MAYNPIKIFKKKYLILLLTCCVVVASFQNFKKNYKNSDNLIPKIYAYQNNQKIFLKDQFIMQLNKNDYCGFAKLCSNFLTHTFYCINVIYLLIIIKFIKSKISFFRLKIKNNQKIR